MEKVTLVEKVADVRLDEPWTLGTLMRQVAELIKEHGSAVSYSFSGSWIYLRKEREETDEELAVRETKVKYEKYIRAERAMIEKLRREHGLD